MKKIVLILSIICFAFKADEHRPIHIFMIGDSTMANKPEKAIPEYGWGQVLHCFFNDSIVVDNHAQNGRSSKSFIDEKRWETVLSKLQKGDYVIIQFGHNDEKSDTVRHTVPFGSYKKNIEKFITETKQKGAIPILCSSIVRRDFDEKGVLKDTHGDYIVAARQVAKETDVYFIDMEAKTRKVEQSMGPEGSKELHLFFKENIYPLRPKKLEDNTHLSQLGAFTVAGLALEGMRELNIPLVKYTINK
jgi:lysophospholipase L1-like esterase